jgi:sugar phosphate isomerase/epimerase
MQIGFVTNCLGPITIGEAVQIAYDLGFDCIEVGPSVERDRAALRDVQRSGPVPIHSFIYGRNFLSKDAAERQSYRGEIARLLDLAVDVGVSQITTSTGVDPALDLDGNIAAALEFWGPLFERAGQAGVRIALEFCPTAGNFALGPYAWRRLLAATSEWPNFGLNYDPSHLLWEFIDPYKPLAEFAPNIFSVHAKDTYVWRDRLAEHGILTPYKRTEEMAHGPEEARAIWWEYRLPGNGQLDWRRFMDELRAISFEGALIIEHEDPSYLGSREAVLKGLRQGLSYLRAASNEY